MKNYSTKEIKNIALLGSDGAGKTTLTEALLFESGIINRRGRISQIWLFCVCHALPC